MAKLRISGKKKNSIVKLKIIIEKLQKSLLLAKKPANIDDIEDASDSTNVPEDVKEGHFAVIAVNDGFDHEGVLTLPCRPSKFEQILSGH
ncbi:hypothetical protein CsSME_00046565 [Camellia sinensis var. sinensis]